MYFVIIANDRPGMLDRRLAIRQTHLDYWNAQPGVVKIAGAQLADPEGEPTPKGSCFIIEAETVAAAQALIAGDPFTRDGIFADDIRIEAIRPALGEWLPG